LALLPKSLTTTRGPEFVDRRERAASGLDSDMQIRDERGRLTEGPVNLVGRRVGAEAKRELGFDRGKAVGEDRKIHAHPGFGKLQLAGKDRADQTLIAGWFAQFGRDVADFPADDPVRPVPYRRVLDPVRIAECRRDRSGKVANGEAVAARLHELPRDRVRALGFANRFVGFANALTLLLRCIAAYHPFQICGQLLYKGNKCHFQLRMDKILPLRCLSIKIHRVPHAAICDNCALLPWRRWEEDR
jgi:hypothetical protein